ncbi:MAG: anhydro-N-acetylmuramic acid kinase [Bacteroidetes bacterium]|nr:anhydro-N-acetylmuramic acid kinase [Bacteroidota bacterium]
MKIAKKQYMIISGAMSGTSMDGIDWVTIKIQMDYPPFQMDVLHSSSSPFPVTLKQSLLDLTNGKAIPVAGYFDIEELITDFYRESYKEHQKGLMIKSEYLACHGQTVFHAPEPISSKNPTRGSLQLLNGQRLAAETGIPVIYQFRQADLAVGGQGAPLVPKSDELLFAGVKPCAILNLGGIANVTLLADNHPTLGFDCGPGNIILDYVANRFFSVPFDRDGILAENGIIQESMVEKALEDKFFSKHPPKSTGRELFSEDWIENWLDSFPAEATKVDFLATAAELTAKAAAESVKKFSKGKLKKVYVSGGGTKNPYLMERLRQAFGPAISVSDTSEVGVSSTFKEAISFAVLGFLRALSLPGNIPSVTGARKPVRLGVIAEP